MAQSNAHMKASNKYNAKAYDRVTLMVRKDGDLTRETLKKIADAAGESVNSYITEAIRQRMARENGGN